MAKYQIISTQNGLVQEGGGVHHGVCAQREQSGWVAHSLRMDLGTQSWGNTDLKTEDGPGAGARWPQVRSTEQGRRGDGLLLGEWSPRYQLIVPGPWSPRTGLLPTILYSPGTLDLATWRQDRHKTSRIH